MNYKILDRRTEQTVFTTVEYDFDGRIVTVDVAHFMPESEQDIITGIENRAVTEQKRLESTGSEVT
jgi:hypothetical protein